MSTTYTMWIYHGEAVSIGECRRTDHGGYETNDDDDGELADAAAYDYVAGLIDDLNNLQRSKMLVGLICL